MVDAINTKREYAEEELERAGTERARHGQGKDLSIDRRLRRQQPRVLRELAHQSIVGRVRLSYIL